MGPAAGNDGHLEVARGRNSDNMPDFFLDGGEIGGIQTVRSRQGFKTAGVGEFRVNDVRADSLNLTDDVLLPGERDGDNQNDAATSDRHSNHGQHRAQLVGRERLPCEYPCLGLE